MTDPLVKSLLQRGLICSKTIVTARVGTRNRIGGVTYSTADYTVEGEVSDGSNAIILRSVIGQVSTVSRDYSILSIDGMSIDRFADVYNINSDGTDKKVGKKRGRKPKNPQA